MSCSFVHTVNPWLSKPQLSEPQNYHARDVDYARIITYTHVIDHLLPCLTAKEERTPCPCSTIPQMRRVPKAEDLIIFATKVNIYTACMYERMHVYLYNIIRFTYLNISLIRTKSSWHLIHGVWINEDSLYIIYTGQLLVYQL